MPLNLFGAGAFSDEAAEYVTDRGSAVSLNQQRVATANLNGSLPFRISPAPIGFNVGVQYRKESGSFDPDPLLSRDYNLFGFTFASRYRGDAGSYYTNEVYGELSVPLVSEAQGIPVVKSLSVDAAIRYVDNSITGLAPAEMAAISKPWSAEGDAARFRKEYLRLLPLMHFNYSAINPVALKSLMKACGLPVGDLRRPLRNLDAAALAEGPWIVRELGLDGKYGYKR